MEKKEITVEGDQGRWWDKVSTYICQVLCLALGIHYLLNLQNNSASCYYYDKIGSEKLLSRLPEETR